MNSIIKSIIFLSFVALAACNCNEDSMVLPCSILENLGEIDNENDLAFEGYQGLKYRLQNGFLDEVWINNPFTLNLFFLEGDTLLNQESNCLETENETKYIWQLRNHQILYPLEFSHFILVRDKTAFDFENPQNPPFGEYTSIGFNGNIDGFGTGNLRDDHARIPRKGESLKGNPEYDFGYEFLETVELNGQIFNDIYSIKNLSSDLILELFLTLDGKLIAYEDAEKGLFLLEE